MAIAMAAGRRPWVRSRRLRVVGTASFGVLGQCPGSGRNNVTWLLVALHLARWLVCLNGFPTMVHVVLCFCASFSFFLPGAPDPCGEARRDKMRGYGDSLSGASELVSPRSFISVHRA